MFKRAQLESVKAWIHDTTAPSLPRHVRIQRAIRKLILEGSLPAGKALPASRKLALSLAVSRDTVEMAYNQLQAEGFIERRIGSGSFVSAQAQLPSSSYATTTHSAALRLSQRGRTMLQSGGLRDFLTPRPFAPGVPETRHFPLHTWERLQRQVLKEYGTRVLTHSAPQGLLALRRAIADYVNLERGAHATPERVLILTSSQQALNLCATVLLDAGERIMVENPVYHGARKAFDAAGLDCVPIPLDEHGVRVEHLTQQAAHALFLTPSHQFPTGATLALERRLAVIEWAQKNQAWIIEDDYDSEFHYEGKPTACVQGLDPYERTLYIGTFTKSLFPGLRLAYMVLPSCLVEPMTLARSLLDGHSAPIAQLTVARFIEGGHFGAHIRSMRAIYAERRNTLVQLAEHYLADFLQVQVPAGGMQMPCFLHAPLAEPPIILAAKQQHIDLLGMRGLYAPHTPSLPGLLMGFAAYTPSEMQQAITVLQRILQQQSSQQKKAPR